MELKEIGGELLYIKKDGTRAQVVVPDRERLAFYGFDTWADSVRLVKGNPKKNDVVLCWLRMSRRDQGHYLLMRGVKDAIKVIEGDMDYARQLVHNPPKDFLALQKSMEKHTHERREDVDIAALAENEGLWVYPARDFDGYWCKECGEFKDLPHGWDFLPRGDAALTRAVRKGPHWVYVRKVKVAGRYVTEKLGTFAPLGTIEAKYEELGGEAGRAKREEAKGKAVEARMESLSERFKQAILRLFPAIPKQALEETLRHAQRPGTVGRAAFLFGASYEEAGNVAFESAAYLAVRAHVRHRHTDYDELVSESALEYGMTVTTGARRQVASDIDEILDSWRRRREQSGA